MKSTFPLTFFVGLFLCLNMLSAQDDSERPKRARLSEPDITATGQLEENDDGTYRAKFDFGRLPAGLNAVIDLKINNPFDKQIKFTGVSKKCKCSNFRADRKYFSPQEELGIRVRLKIPTRKNSSKAQTTMMIVNQGVSVAELVFDYELEGVLGFNEFIGIVGFDSDNQTKTLDIPFIATRPVDLDKLSLTKSKNLAGCQFEIIAEGESGVVRATISDSILAKSIIRGEIMIEETGTNRRDTFFLTIKNQKLAEISPAVISFKKTTSALVATATLKMAKSIADEAALENIQLECLHDGTAVESKLKRVSDKLVKVELTAGEELKKATPEAAILNWKIVHEGATTNLETPFVVSQ